VVVTKGVVTAGVVTKGVVTAGPQGISVNIVFTKDDFIFRRSSID
jgi:hypothetical protein